MFFFFIFCQYYIYFDNGFGYCNLFQNSDFDFDVFNLFGRGKVILREVGSRGNGNRELFLVIILSGY